MGDVRPLDEREKKIVTPLRKLLMDVSLEELMAFLHRSHLQFSMIRQRTGMYRVCIFKDGMLRYGGNSNESLRAALADALSRFMQMEEKDYHSY